MKLDIAPSCIKIINCIKGIKRLTTSVKNATVKGWIGPDSNSRLVFDQARVKIDGEDSEESSRVTSGMANIDWFLLLAYHLKKLAWEEKDIAKFVKTVGRCSCTWALSKAKVEFMVAKFAAMQMMSKRFTKDSGIHMCPLALTPHRLINCVSMMEESVSEVHLLRMKLGLVHLGTAPANEGDVSHFGG